MRLVSVGCVVLASGFSAAQVREIPGHFITEPPEIDGTIGEEEWAGTPSLKGLVDTLSNAPAQEDAEFWIGYDANYIYLAARLQDPNPSQIRANEYRTNVSMNGDDNVGVYFDLGGSATDFNFFQMNARGATGIFLSGGRAAKREWTGDFISKGRITATGWEVEARIPWQICKLPGAGKRTLRVNFERYNPRTQRTFQSANINSGGTSDCPRWLDVEVPPQNAERSLKLLPYSYFGYDREQLVFNSGLDLKTQITSQVELVGSINPDFRNIENQVLSLDFSRFERLTSETRPFFQEGSEYISSALFASQRIDSFDVGANLYGRLSNKTSFGFLNTTDWDRLDAFGNGTQRETRNNLVATVAHNFDPTFGVRVGVTSMNRANLKNDAYLARVSKRFGDFVIGGRYMGSKDSVNGDGRYEDASVNYARNGWFGNASYVRVDPNFNPRLGFFPERNYWGGHFNLGYDKNLDRGALNYWGFYLSGLSFQRIDNDPYRKQISFATYATLRNGLTFSGQTVQADFEGSKDELYIANVSYPSGNPYSNASISYNWGHQAGLPYDSLSIGSAYRFSSNLQTNLNFQRVHYAGQADQVVASASYDLGKDRSLAGRLVYQDGDTNFYLALRQSGNLGTEYFLILGDPNALTFRSSVILKVTVPFEIPLGGRRTPQKQLLSG